jgi:hypothetical protein
LVAASQFTKWSGSSASALRAGASGGAGLYQVHVAGVGPSAQARQLDQ